LLVDALVTPQTTAPRAINVTMIFMISLWQRASKHTRRSVALIMAGDAEGVPTAAVLYRISQQDDMDTSTLLIIIIVVLIVLGGGWYGRGRWY
jgi:Kef-type K+ transport system membrane component KefB